MMLTLKEILKVTKQQEQYHSVGCMCAVCFKPQRETVEQLRAEIEKLKEENKRLRFMIEEGLGPEDMERDI